MIGRLRRVVPASRLVPLLLPYLALEGLVLYGEWKLGRPFPEPKFHVAAAFFLRVAAVVYAVTRIVGTHPYLQRDYRAWLERTPWTVRKPLPQGPVELVWEDGVFLGALVLLHALLPLSGSVKILNQFLIVQVLMLSWTFFATGAATSGYLSLLGLGLVVRFWPSPWVCFAIAVSTYLVAYDGLWRSLARFPWQNSEFWEAYYKVYLNQKEAVASSLGWPQDRFLKDVHDARRLRVNRLDALLISMLIGFWIFCAQSLFTNPGDRLGFLAFSLIAVAILPGVRLAIYAMGCAGPISFWGRILKGYWIIPGYDRVFLGSLLIPLVAGAVLGSLYLAGAPLEITLPATTSAAFATALLAPPRLRDWRLTGKYRMTWLPTKDGPNSPYVKAG